MGLDWTTPLAIALITRSHLSDSVVAGLEEAFLLGAEVSELRWVKPTEVVLRSPMEMSYLAPRGCSAEGPLKSEEWHPVQACAGQRRGCQRAGELCPNQSRRGVQRAAFSGGGAACGGSHHVRPVYAAV